ncbi:class I SAM-dependent methyltransferase [Planomonospora sp. ID91781]|uniref:Methyltransferase type 12 n=2 Tax=Planomonospora sphaerica TaxID=161355 RepID=A0A171DKT3_9ACTN|nr:class I SAM-dependent methyltransferase [Planomonospora sp. ID91781]MBG0823052.1 class I SAM-dependent methyltransferase [Planomonospora sp. ID91781]GAT69441.1 methyltransferase type 12 [Planomonospora sphaerica]
MTGQPIPERISWAVGTLDLMPSDRVLEIGCGRGLAAALVLGRLTEGSLAAIDRSAAAIAAAAQRNSRDVAAGRANFLVAALEESAFPAGSFDRIFSINVNLFWTRDPVRELGALRRWLAPGGSLHLCWEPPHPGRVKEIVAAVTPAMEACGLAATVLTGRTSRSAGLVCLVGRAHHDPS